MSILYLGNIEFEMANGDEQQCQVKSSSLKYLTKITKLFDLVGIDNEIFSGYLTNKEVKVGGMTKIFGINKRSAKDARDSFAKKLYEILFL